MPDMPQLPPAAAIPLAAAPAPAGALPVTRLLVALLAALALAGCAAPTQAPPAPQANAQGPAVPAPVRVVIGSIGVDSSLIRTGMLPDGSPEVPPVTDPGQASWATWSPEPGAVGPATLYGHVDGVVNGKRGVLGVFARIKDLRDGDEVLVGRSDGSTVRFLVYAVRPFPKADVPEDQVYGDTPGPELRLVTCGGDFDQGARSYRDQIVVYARQAQA